MSYEIQTKEGIVIVNPRIPAIKGYTTKKDLKKQMQLFKEVKE